jgi:hypothetical protein
MSPVRGCPVCGAGNCRRHARRRSSPSERRGYSGTAAERQMVEAVLEAYGGSCVYCHLPIDLEAPRRSDRGLELAHVIPHADGGPFELDNLRPSHRICNRTSGREPIIGA